jgi:hypothetical protein
MLMKLYYVWVCGLQPFVAGPGTVPHNPTRNHLLWLCILGEYGCGIITFPSPSFSTVFSFAQHSIKAPPQISKGVCSDAAVMNSLNNTLKRLRSLSNIQGEPVLLLASPGTQSVLNHLCCSSADYPLRGIRECDPERDSKASKWSSRHIKTLSSRPGRRFRQAPEGTLVARTRPFAITRCCRFSSAQRHRFRRLQIMSTTAGSSHSACLFDSAIARRRPRRRACSLGGRRCKHLPHCRPGYAGPGRRASRHAGKRTHRMWRGCRRSRAADSRSRRRPCCPRRAGRPRDRG